MSLEKLFNRNVWALVFVVAAVYLIWRQFRKRNELEQHALEQNLLGEIGSGVSTVENLALEEYPLAEVGLEPLAGIETDPFNPDSIASRPHDLELSPSIPQAGGAIYQGGLAGITGATTAMGIPNEGAKTGALAGLKGSLFGIFGWR